MFCSKSNYNLLNKIYHRALCAVYFRYDLGLEELLHINGSYSIHTKHLQILMVEVFKSLHKLNPPFMWNFFQIKDLQYSLRSQTLLKLPNPKTRSYGLNSMIFRASLLWNSLPNDLKCCPTLNEFKSKIKSWDGRQCTCMNCRTF